VSTGFDNQAFIEQTTYDQYGRVFQQFDAAGDFFGLRHYYNAQGYAYKQVEARNSGDSNAKVYYEVKATDAFGNVTQFAQNDGKVITTKVYDPETGFLSEIQANTNDGLVQDNEYQFDALGNLRTRTNNTLKSGVIGQSEIYDYDDLNRLTHLNNNQVVSYYANGNIRWKSDLNNGNGAFYCYRSSRPHAVSGLSGSANCTTNDYQYDANGNMLSGRGRSITYSHFDKPTLISTSGASTTFSYDLTRSRYKRETTEGGVKTTTYYAGNVEVVYKNNVFSENRRYLPGAIQTRYKGGVIQTRYLHKDHLGSIDSITDENGKLVEKLYFDAWGKRQSIDKGNWTSAVQLRAAATLVNVLDISNRGFTGHEHVDHADIIHMNGRIYDPTLGRFLQADPHIQAPSNSQSYNRYSYVLNNPLSYTDPSGYFFSGLWKKIKPFISVIIVAVASYVCAGACTAGVWAAIGGTAGGVGAAVNGGNILEGALIGAFTAGASTYGMAAAAISGGIASKVQGGNFGHGFWSAGLGAGIGGGTGQGFTKVITAAIVGGTISKLTGGKFSNGAISAAFAAAVAADWGSDKRNAEGDANYFSDSDKGALDKAIEELNTKRDGVIFSDKENAAKWLNDNVGSLQDQYNAEVGARLYDVYGVDGGVAIGEIVTSYHSNQVNLRSSVLSTLAPMQSNGGLVASWHSHPNGGFIPSWGGATGRDSGNMPINMVHYVSSMNGNGVMNMSLYNPNLAWANGPITRSSFDNSITCVVGSCR
jgi:RHS repeat-associated protein